MKIIQSIKQLCTSLKYFSKEKHTKFATRKELEEYQQKELTIFSKKISTNNAYFSQFLGLDISAWPQMNKTSMLKYFDDMNTAGLKLEDIFNLALNAEKERDFSTKLNGFTVGLSSGTSGQRGVFVVNNQENAMWSGIILAKILPNLFSFKNIINKQKVAFFLRANSNLYKSMNSPWLTFKFFDLFTSIDINIENLTAYQPNILIAPAQVLRYLALKKLSGELKISPEKIISVAEVLDKQDKYLIKKAFFENEEQNSLYLPQSDLQQNKDKNHDANITDVNAGKMSIDKNLHQVYQATEGLLATTCRLGNLHLNEKYVHIKPLWLDESETSKRRFNPIITDFTRITQPIINYRLNDVLIMSDKPCACGDVSHMIESIEGRNDDILWLPNIDKNSSINNKQIPIFADMLSRSIAKHLSLYADYQLVQVTNTSLKFSSNVNQKELELVKKTISIDLQAIGVDINAITWELNNKIDTNFTQKRRRIINLVPKK